MKRGKQGCSWWLEKGNPGNYLWDDGSVPAVVVVLQISAVFACSDCISVHDLILTGDMEKGGRKIFSFPPVTLV